MRDARQPNASINIPPASEGQSQRRPSSIVTPSLSKMVFEFVPQESLCVWIDVRFLASYASKKAPPTAVETLYQISLDSASHGIPPMPSMVPLTDLLPSLHDRFFKLPNCPAPEACFQARCFVYLPGSLVLRFSDEDRSSRLSRS